MRHEFHNTIREVLSSLDTNPFTLVWDEACGGSARLSLFRDYPKNRQSWYTCPDAILFGPVVRLIIEIEEAGSPGFRAAHIFGKYAAAAHSRVYIPVRGPEPIPLAAVTFIQIIRTSGIKAASKKRLQYDNIETDI